MLDEEMDDIIKQAAEQHHPSYDNKAWDKMEQLLDKHLPQKKDRRGIAFFLLLGLLIGGGLFVGGYYFMGNKKATVASVETKKVVEKSPETQNLTQNIVPGNNLTANQKAPPSVNTSGNNNINVPGQKQNNNATVNSSEPTHSRAFKVARSAAKTSMDITSGVATADEATATKGSPSTGKPQPEKNLVNNDLTTIIASNADKKNSTTDVKENAVENKQDVQPAVKKAAGIDIAKEKGAEPVNKKTTASTEKKRSKNSIAGNFGFSFSAGPDISFVELNKPGKVTMAYGVGLSYTFIKKLTLQSGFYVSRKIYSADSADYHAPGGFWTAYPGMDNTVAANCKVYEVPVNLFYNFKQKGKHNLYAGAGLSTYFMKHEGYDYSYTLAGMVFPKSFTIDNQNQHNFSVLTLAGGYKYNVSPHISVSAEPYVKLPLNGIGFGNVKLKGSGVMMNVTVKPFARKK